MRKFYTVLLILSALGLTACEGEGGSAEPGLKSPPPTEVIEFPGSTLPVSDMLPEDEIETEQVALTFYTVSHTFIHSSAYPQYTYTASATCFEFESMQICWDDGVHSVHNPAINFTYRDTYFNFYYNQFNKMGQCILNCPNSYLATPKLMSDRRGFQVMRLDTSIGKEVDRILRDGSPTDALCTRTGNKIECGTVTIDLDNLT